MIREMMALFAAGKVTEPAFKLAQLFEIELNFASGAIEDYQAAKAPGREEHLLRHAVSFVTAMRRAAGMLEEMTAKSAGFPKDVAQAIRLEWRKKNQALYKRFTEARIMIEHPIDHISVPGGNSYTLVDDNLIVASPAMFIGGVEGKKWSDYKPVAITRDALTLARSSLDEISKACRVELAKL